MSAALTPALRAEFLALVDREFGIRGSDYGAARLDEAVTRVLPTTPCRTAAELFEACAAGSQPGWLAQLVEHLTVGETYFMRDPAQIAALRETILPDVIARRASERRIRLWSAGCSTGEEPYTLAMLLEELTVLTNWELLLVGTDVNRESLRIAREACYPAWSFRATPDAMRERHFESCPTGWRLKEPLRRIARFAWMNLGAESIMPPSADFDLIVCRNVTIYFDEAATQRLYRTLIGALAPGGWLMLGPSDPVPVDRDDLERLEIANTILWRRRAIQLAVPVALPRRVEITPASQARPRADRKEAQRPISTVRERASAPRAQAELEAGLLALEAGSVATALEWLRQASFRDPRSPLAQFALGQAYLELGDVARAHAALLHTRRLLSSLASDTFVPGSDAMRVEMLRQAVQTHLAGIEGAA